MLPLCLTIVAPCLSAIVSFITRFILSAINPSQPDTIEGFPFLFGGWLALLPVQVVQHLTQSPGQTIHIKVLLFAHVGGELASFAALPTVPSTTRPELPERT